MNIEKILVEEILKVLRNKSKKKRQIQLYVARKTNYGVADLKYETAK